MSEGDHFPGDHFLADQQGTWEVENSEDLFRDDWVIALRADRIRPPEDDQEPLRRLVLEHPGAAVVLAVDDDDRVFCLRQYRHAGGGTFVELPAGLCDVSGEAPIEAARRELREEAGLQAADWTHVTSAFASPGISAEVHHFFLARGISQADRGDFVPHGEEALMETKWVPREELRAAILDGRVADAPVILALLATEARGLLSAAPTGE